MVDVLMIGKFIFQTSVGLPHFEISGRLDGHYISDDVLQSKFVYLSNRNHIDDSVLALLNLEIRMLKLLSTLPAIDLVGLS